MLLRCGPAASAETAWNGLEGTFVRYLGPERGLSAPGGAKIRHPQAVRTSSPARRAAFQVHHAVSPPAINARRPRRSSSVSADRSGRVSSGTCFSSFSGACFSMSWISLI